MKISLSAPMRSATIIGLIIMFVSILSCRGVEYTTQHFSFPPGSKPHENDWQYTALVIVSSKQRPMTTKSNKKVTIKIYDRSKVVYLSDDFEFNSASIDAKVVWNKFEELSIELYEVGNEFAADTDNKRLMKSGPIKLLKLLYEYSREDKKFKKLSSQVPLNVH